MGNVAKTDSARELTRMNDVARVEPRMTRIETRTPALDPAHAPNQFCFTNESKDQDQEQEKVKKKC